MDWSDALIVAGWLLALGGIWWMTHPGAALLAAGITIVAMGLLVHVAARR